MQLTPRAESLRTPLAAALDQVRGLFTPDGFDPGASTRRFTLMMPDHVVDLVVPRLLDRIASTAPAVRVDVAPWTGATSIHPDIDLIIACIDQPITGFTRQRLFSDTEAIALRRDHPERARLRLLQSFAFEKLRYVAVVGRGQREDLVDTWLRDEHGIERKIGLVVPSYLQALHVAARSSLAAFVPLRLIEALAKPLALRACPSPIDPGFYEETLFQPLRAQQDPGSNWLKQHVLAVGRSLDRNRRVAA